MLAFSLSNTYIKKALNSWCLRNDFDPNMPLVSVTAFVCGVHDVGAQRLLLHRVSHLVWLVSAPDHQSRVSLRMRCELLLVWFVIVKLNEGMISAESNVKIFWQRKLYRIYRYLLCCKGARGAVVVKALRY